MLMHFYALGLVLLALLPAAMMRKNLPLFQRLPRSDDLERAPSPDAQSDTCLSVSVLIPARNEEPSIGACLDAVLASSQSDIEVIVMDDASTDATRSICESIAQTDRRLKVLEGGELPVGWNGKQHACWQLSLIARGRWLLFIDADVRLSRDAIPRLLRVVEQSPVDLLSGFPKQITRSWSEQLIIPLMHFVLLGYLPLSRMRASSGAEFAAGCGQLFLARREAYRECEGHKSIANSRHDGLKLPRAFRRQGFKTDIFDASDIATCRMYNNAREVMIGVLKNATEGIANPRTIGIFTLLMVGGAVLPLASLLVAAWVGASGWVLIEFCVATVLSYLPRVDAARKFGHAWLGVVLHPLSVLAFIVLQWIALTAELFGLRIRWRGRS